MIYKIILKPVTPYFFGLEQVSELGNKRSYFLKSAIYPQQTTILGMLRYQILAQKGLLSPDKNKRESVKEIIGEKSFSPDNLKGYGMIKQLTPVQLSCNYELYFMRNREYITHADKVKKLHVEMLELNMNEFVNLSGNKNEIVLLKYPDNESEKVWIEKDIFSEFFQSLQTTMPVSVDDLFHESGRVGIEKAWEGETKSNAYYKQFFKVLTELRPVRRPNGESDKLEDIKMTPKLYAKKKIKSGWCFCFEVKIDKDFPFDCKERFVSMGGEQSQFLMSVKPLKNKNEFSDETAHIPELKEGEAYKLILTSDTCIENEEAFYKLPFFVNAETVRFRNFISTVDKTENYTIKSERQKGFTQSIASFLLKRGGIFYFKDKETLEEAINQINGAKVYRTIGYNYFIIEKEIIKQIKNQ